MSRGPSIRRPAVFCAGVVALALAGAAVAPLPALAAGRHAAAPAPASTIKHFTVVATSSNTHADQLTINNSATNGKANALLFVSPNYSAGGHCGCEYDDNPVMVYYTGAQWQIVNTEGSTIALGTEFNVLVVPASTANAFVVTATSTNIVGDSVYITSSSTNGKRSLKLLATQVSDGLSDPSPAGVWYDKTRSKWAVFNELGAAMQSGISFNILVGSVSGAKVAVQTATPANTGADFTTINNSTMNGKATAFVLETPLWNLNGAASGVYDGDTTGVWYDAPKWTVFQEDNVDGSMPNGARFDLLFFS